MPETPPPGPVGDHAERVLRRALASEAAGVAPGPAPRVHQMTARPPARRWPTALAAAAAVAGLVAVSAALLPSGTGPAPVAAPTSGAPTQAATTAPPDASTEPTDPAASSPAPPAPVPGPEAPSDPGPAATKVAPPQDGRAILWSVTEAPVPGGVDLRLVPGRVQVDLSSSAEGTDTVLEAAVDRLLSGPAPDPDHANPWWWDGQQVGDAALGVVVSDEGTTVDLPSTAFDGPVGTPLAGAGLATLVRTVVSNGGTAPVTILVDGEPGAEVWGAFVLDEPLKPDSRSLAGGWILDPYEGQRVAAGPVVVSGTATAFEANVLWDVTDAQGVVVAEGFTSAGANGEYGPFTFTVDLEAGRYTVAVREPSMAGEDEGPALVWQDTKTIDVVG